LLRITETVRSES